MTQVREIRETWSPKLNDLIKTLKDGGPSNEELTLMSIIAIMDETMRELSRTQYHAPIFQTYNEIEAYIESEGVGH